MGSNGHIRGLIQVAGVDTHAGVEDASGRKDRHKVEQFVTETKTAFKLL